MPILSRNEFESADGTSLHTIAAALAQAWMDDGKNVEADSHIGAGPQTETAANALLLIGEDGYRGMVGARTG